MVDIDQRKPDEDRMQSHSVCWNCEKSLEDEDVCPSCVKVQPFGPGQDYYDILDIPAKLVVDPRLLVSTYHEKSRTFHPDHHIGESDKEQTISLSNSSLVNLAFRTLSDPFSRARYFIGRLKGEAGHLHKKTALSPADLMEIMDLKEDLEDSVRHGRKDEAEQRLRELINFLDSGIFSLCERIDRKMESEGKESPSLADDIPTLEARLEKRSYLHNLSRELKGAK